MKKLAVWINDREVVFEGEDAIKVQDAIEKAGARGAAWTTPIELSNGEFMTLVIDKIAAWQHT